MEIRLGLGLQMERKLQISGSLMTHNKGFLVKTDLQFLLVGKCSTP